jgi:hypothetical protein
MSRTSQLAEEPCTLTAAARNFSSHVSSKFISGWVGCSFSGGREAEAKKKQISTEGIVASTNGSGMKMVYRDDCLGPITLVCGHYLKMQNIKNGVEVIIFIFKRPIRAEVATYRKVVVLGSLHMQRNDQGIIQNRSAKIYTTAVSLYLSASYFSFRFLRPAEKNRANGKCRNSCFLAVRMEVKRT